MEERNAAPSTRARGKPIEWLGPQPGEARGPYRGEGPGDDMGPISDRPAILPMAFRLVGNLIALQDMLARVEEAVHGPSPAAEKCEADKPCGLADALQRANDDSDRLGKRLMALLEALGRPVN